MPVVRGINRFTKQRFQVIYDLNDNDAYNPKDAEFNFRIGKDSEASEPELDCSFMTDEDIRLTLQHANEVSYGISDLHSLPLRFGTFRRFPKKFVFMRKEADHLLDKISRDTVIFAGFDLRCEGRTVFSNIDMMPHIYNRIVFWNEEEFNRTLKTHELAKNHQEIAIKPVHQNPQEIVNSILANQMAKIVDTLLKDFIEHCQTNEIFDTTYTFRMCKNAQSAQALRNALANHLDGNRLFVVTTENEWEVFYRF